jgi:hypothetical protein
MKHWKDFSKTNLVFGATEKYLEKMPFLLVLFAAGQAKKMNRKPN